MLGKQLGMLKTAEGPIKPIEKSAHVSIADLKEEEIKVPVKEEIKAQTTEGQNTMSDEPQEENNALDSTKIKKKSAKSIRIEEQIAVYTSNIKILEEKLAEEEDETSPEAVHLKNEIEEAKKKKEDLEISLLEAEQEEEISKEEAEKERIELSQKMLSMEEEKTEEKEQAQPEEIAQQDTAQNTENEIEIDPRLAQLQQQLQERGILSRVEGTGNMQYLKTDQAGLQQIDPNTTTIEQIDQTLQQQEQEMAIQQAMKETEEDKARRAETEKERILDKYVSREIGNIKDMPPMPSSS